MDIHNIKSYFNERAETWDETMEVRRQKLAQTVRMLKIQKGHKVLDIGCGTGVLFDEMLAYQPKRIVGIDVSDEMIRHAQFKHNDDRIRLIADDFLTNDLRCFDRAVLFDAYPHFQDKAALARKISEAVKPGGRFLLAHHRGRAHINHNHVMQGAADISIALNKAEIEMKWFESYFKVDDCVDNDDMFAVLGIKKHG